MKLTHRVAYLAPDASSSDTSRNIKVNLLIEGALPFISASQSAYGNTADQTDPANIVYMRAFGDLYIGDPTDQDFKNHLVDPDNTDRYTPIAIVTAAGTGYNYYIYHDDKFKDILLFPNLRHIGDDPVSEEYLKNQVLNISAYRVGAYLGENSNGLVTAPDVPIDSIPKPQKYAKSKLHIFPLITKSGTSLYNNFGIEVRKGYLESMNMSTSVLNSLGDSQSLFGDKVPAMRLIDVGVNQSRIVKIGRQDLSDILIPIP